MDKYEYKLKLDQMKSLTAEKDYKTAAEIADTINWNKVKNVNSLMKVGEIYEKTERYEESRDILLMAYDRSPIGRMIIRRLVEVAVKMGNYDEAKDYYQEFVQIAPHDNFKYVLKYKISKAEGADTQTLIAILEELKEQEYSEEWTFELACLYHKAGMSEKCIDACDELILYFGDGPYVERALELKMLYQPLSRQQEEKYRQFRQRKDGIVEVRPGDELESGEIISEPVQIPKVSVSAERFNTQNLQEELQRSMQQIMEATEKETVDDSMDNIKKLVEEIPYLQLPKEEPMPEDEEQFPHIETDAEIDTSLRINFQEMLAEDYDGQMSLYVSEKGHLERQITGQLSIGEILGEWEKTKRAAETALQDAEQRKLESAKARALQEAGDIMERLADVIPKLDSGLTPMELLEEQYLSEPLGDEKAAAVVANMNQILQQEIDRLSTENARMDEQLAAVSAGGQAGSLFEMPVREPEASEILESMEVEDLTDFEDLEEINIGAADEPVEKVQNTVFEESRVEVEADITASGAIEAADAISEPEEQIAGTDARMVELAADVRKLLEENQPEMGLEHIGIGPKGETQEDETALQTAEIVSGMEEADTVRIEEGRKLRAERRQNALREKKVDTTADKLQKIMEPEAEAREYQPIRNLSEEQREIFTYFVQIGGMEKQLARALGGAAQRLLSGGRSSTGNLIIQGGQGSGKTVLATDMIKALQAGTGKLKGRVGKIEASVLNQKDPALLLKKVAGGSLIIEKAGEISKETAVKLSNLLGRDTSGVFVIIEDTCKGIEKALGRDAGFASRFSEKINIPVFTSDELVSFAKSYANEQGYTIDEMGVLALYNSIGSIEKLDRATTLAEVKEIVDQAIEKAERGGLKKAFGILTSRRYDEDDYVILREKDFGF